MDDDEPTSRYRSRIYEWFRARYELAPVFAMGFCARSAFYSLGSRALTVSLSHRSWFVRCVRGKRTFDERLECSFRAIEGQGIPTETMGGVMIQVNSAQFPHKLV
jgi:hypothetical protein